MIEDGDRVDLFDHNDRNQSVEYDALKNYSDDQTLTVKKDGGGTKFASYQLPGGTSYRELLLTLPKRQEKQSVEDTSGWTVETVDKNSFTGQRQIVIRDETGRQVSQRSGFAGTDEQAINHIAESRADT